MQNDMDTARFRIVCVGHFEISSVAFIVASCLMRDMEKLTDFTAATPEFVLKE